MRIHIENLTNKLEEYERERGVLEGRIEQEIKEVKREKRRLDDLLTIREEEIDKLKEKEK